MPGTGTVNCELNHCQRGWSLVQVRPAGWTAGHGEDQRPGGVVGHEPPAGRWSSRVPTSVVLPLGQLTVKPTDRGAASAIST